MSLRTTTSYSRAFAAVIIITAASAAPPTLLSIAFSRARLMRDGWAPLLQQLERIAEARRIRAVFLPLGPDIDHHVDAVAGRHHLDLVRGIARIRNAVDAGLAGDGCWLAGAQRRAAPLGVVLHQVLKILAVRIFRPSAPLHVNDADQVGVTRFLDQEHRLRRLGLPDAPRRHRRLLRQRDREAVSLGAEFAPGILRGG